MASNAITNDLQWDWMSRQVSIPERRSDKEMKDRQPSPMTAKVLMLALLLAGLASGCHLRPEFGSPGTMDTQRNRSLQHDPFPSNELGPPIAGIRPRDFDLPRSEVTQLQTSPTARRGAPVVTGGF